MKTLLAIVKGMLIGLANIIPGVSGGTLMVSMGIYDTLIYCITHLFTQFRKSVKTILPYAVGMAVAIVALSFALTWAFEHYPLPTNALFIGLILGGLPAIVRQLKGERIGWIGGVLFAVFFALIILLQIFQKENVATITLSVTEVLKLFCFGVIASATMVIPGVSGSMVLKLIGYYEPVIGAVKALVSALTGGEWSAVLQNVGILLPFALGVVAGIFAIAKLIEMLLAKWKGFTYSAILGLVCASPVAILLGCDLSVFNVWVLLASVAAFALGFFTAAKLDDTKTVESAAK